MQMLRSNCRWHATLMVIVLLGMHSQVVLAQSKPGAMDPKDYSPEALRKQFLREAEAYEIEAVREKRKLVLQKQPLLNWQNPERPSTLGSLFVWLDGGRPAAIASIFTFEVNQQLRRKHEVISLFPESMVATLDGEPVWSPGPLDIKGIDIGSIPAPAASDSGRLTQMRNIARDLIGKHQPREGGAARELRLLSQPIIRYHSAADKIVDGALFALSVGTDPEILLLIEARQSKEGAEWKVVPLRSHFDELELQHKQKVVWKAPLISQLMTTRPMDMPFAKDPFFVFYPTKSIPSAEELKQLDAIQK